MKSIRTGIRAFVREVGASTLQHYMIIRDTCEGLPYTCLDISPVPRSSRFALNISKAMNEDATAYYL